MKARSPVRTRPPPALVVAAPPRTLAELREALPADVKARISAGGSPAKSIGPLWDRSAIHSFYTMPKLANRET